MADSWELPGFLWLIRDFVVFVVRFQGCLWRGPAPRHTCPSPMSMCASHPTSSLVLVRSRSRLPGSLWIALGLFVSESLFGGRQGWGAWHLPCPFLGVVYVVGLLAAVRGSFGAGWLGIPLSVGVCAWLLGSSGPGAWHPDSSWVSRPGVVRVSAF